MSYTKGGQNIAGQFGMPLYGIAGRPPFTGNYFWVDAAAGSDGNTGGPQDPLATLTAAHALCTAGNNDVVFLTGVYKPTATLTWSKNATHLIGLDPPSALGAGSTISIANAAATTGAFSPLVNVTAVGCLFEGITAISGIAQAAAQVTWADAGGSNTYVRCLLNQVANATAAAHAGNRALTLASKGNTFVDCVIGGDGIVRATGTNYTMETLAGSGSSIFKGCVFPMWSSVAASAQINAATATGTGFFVFDSCAFINAMGNAGATASTLPLVISATAGAVFLVMPSTVFLGIAGLVATTGQLVYISGPLSVTGGNKALNVT